jgi:hypothetical protein
MKSIDKDKFFNDIRAQPSSPDVSDTMLQQLREKASQVNDLFKSSIYPDMLTVRFSMN